MIAERLLILVPTEYELKHLKPHLARLVADMSAVIAVCGFGPITSGICATRLINLHTPDSVVLVGIAGSLHPDLRIGMASGFSSIGCYGIGAGSGSEFQTAAELGWNQWADSDSLQTFDDTIQIRNTFEDAVADAPMLLTVCAASANAADVSDRLYRFPHAVAEDMESFSVAVACRMADIPLTVIRGISNMAGDRNKANWDVATALKAAAGLTVARAMQ